MSSENLRKARQQWINEIQGDPQLKRAVVAMMATEGERDPVPVMESLYNRAMFANKPIKDMLLSGFYGPINRGELPDMIKQLDKDPTRRAKLEAALDAAAGSNLIQGATDQGLPSDPNGQHQGGRIVRGGNVFNDWGGGPGGHAAAAAFRQDLQNVAQDDTGDKSMLPSQLLGFTPNTHKNPFPAINPNDPKLVIPPNTGAPVAPGIGGTPALPYLPTPGVSLASNPVAPYGAGLGGGTDLSSVAPGAPVTPDAAPAGATDLISKLAGNKDAMAGLGDIAKGLRPRAAGSDASQITTSGTVGNPNAGAMASNILAQLLAGNRQRYGISLAG